MRKFEEELLKEVVVASENSHKGENGRVLVIGGSKLFHAAALWPAEVASKIVDLVHFSSPASENNDLVRVKAKEKFWNGIVVPWSKIEEYIEEDDVVLIGPGMVRKEGEFEGEEATGEIVNKLLKKFHSKKWVVDGGALQEVDPELLSENVIVTPHSREFERVFGGKVSDDLEERVRQVEKVSKNHGCTVLLKGKEDVVSDGSETMVIEGGNVGMTKGGTGDVLAGIVAGLYAKNNPFIAAVVSSYVNKKAGELLAQEVGKYYNASDLVMGVSEVLGEELG